jgi:hypothetical protein
VVRLVRAEYSPTSWLQGQLPSSHFRRRHIHLLLRELDGYCLTLGKATPRQESEFTASECFRHGTCWSRQESMNAVKRYA